jgi:hypothetical protein
MLLFYIKEYFQHILRAFNVKSFPIMAKTQCKHCSTLKTNYMYLLSTIVSILLQVRHHSRATPFTDNLYFVFHKALLCKGYTAWRKVYSHTPTENVYILSSLLFSLLIDGSDLFMLPHSSTSALRK